jgi:hypothetical protein
LVRLSYLGETFQVESVRSVPYQSVRVDLPVLAWT